MEPAVNAIKKFQNVALLATAGTVAYYFLNEPQQADLKKQARTQDKRQGHTLTGEPIEKDKQGLLAKALDTDCEHCLETRRKLFGMFQSSAKPDDVPPDRHKLKNGG